MAFNTNPPNRGSLFKKPGAKNAFSALLNARSYDDIRRHFNEWAARRGYVCRLRDGGPLKPLEYYNGETGEVPD